MIEIARAYVRFAAAHRPMVEVLFEAGLDKAQYPELKAAKQPIDDMFLGAVSALSSSDVDAKELASAIEAVAHGHAMLLLDGAPHPSADAAKRASDRARRATLAVITGFTHAA